MVARLVVDDYDTLKLCGDDCFFPAQFTWLISATRRRTSASVDYHRNAPTVVGYVRENLSEGSPVLGAALDDVLNGCCSLRCASDYTGEYINSTVCGFRRIVVPGGRVAGFLRDLDVPDEVFEMVNADAIGAAAATLGIAAESVGDLFRRLIGGHLDKLAAAARCTARIALVRTGGLQTSDTQADTQTDTQTYDPETAAGLRKSLKEGSDSEFAACWTSPAAARALFEGILLDISAQCAEVTEKYGKPLNRLRDNIREGCCQVCTVPFERGNAVAEPTEEAAEEAAYILVGCCQIIICEHCVTRQVSGQRQFIARCPNCAVDLNPKKGLVRIGAEFDLGSAMKDEALSAAAPVPVPVPAPVPVPGAAAPVEFANPKLRALVQFIQGAPVEALRNEVVAPFVRGLLEGVRDIPGPAQPTRILVFTMHAESTRHIEFALGVAGVTYSVMRGTRAQKDAAVEAVRTAAGPAVLLVTAAKDCAGTHLPFLSHIVFYHRVLDRNVEEQLAARGQRLGRVHNLEVVLLANEAEADLRA
jgi:hypothetical protein